ncbi:hypothetical protein BDN70DRAFT_153023 [Pholiota conissans]|uniref:Uncharacterized protein n=1 Tax=Pholiota conissans TaxID=109636 RepID=A0A9P5YVV5_9AGAR|nr:hypothetical protein BDN70DRAFT_153023 [Pholiota conissans]
MSSMVCDADPSHERWKNYRLVTIILSTVAWCIVVMLAFHAFQAKFKTTGSYTKKMRLILLFYVVVMAGISTASVVQYIVLSETFYPGKVIISFIQGDVSTHPTECTYTSPIPFITSSATISLAIFGADSLMVWRCWVLYQGIYRPLEVCIKCLLLILWLSSLAFVCKIFSNLQFLGIPEMVMMLIFVSMVINLVLSLMIIFRLLFHERRMKAILGAQKGPSPFKKVMAMCVESCVLIIIGAILCVTSTVLSFSSANRSVGSLVTSLDLIVIVNQVTSVDLALISFALLPHICVISPLLLIVRVVNGRAHSTTTPTLSDCTTAPPNNHRQRHSIRFAPPISTTGTDEESNNIILPE